MTWLLLLKRYWKPLAALVLVALLLSWVYGKGRESGAEAWKQKLQDRELSYQKERLANAEAATKALEASEQARRAAQEQLNKLAALPPKVIERVRTNPSHCVLPRPVTDGLREQADATNAAIRLRRAARAAGK